MVERRQYENSINEEVENLFGLWNRIIFIITISGNCPVAPKGDHMGFCT